MKQFCYLMSVASIFQKCNTYFHNNSYRFIKIINRRLQMFKIVQRKDIEDNGQRTREQKIIPKQETKNIQTSHLLLKNEKSAVKSESGAVGSFQNRSTKDMDSSIRLIDDAFELTDLFKEFVNDANKKFTVIGAVGPQGTGKSTIISLLAGNDVFDMYRQYMFRPCARESVEACRYQTSKISIYISKRKRIFFLDCQPLNCVPLLEDISHSYRSKAGPMESLELETQQLLLFLANICDTILLCIDWFIDLSVVRRLMRIELFPNFLQKNGVNLVVIHQRAKLQDFQPLLIEERMNILEGIFKNSFFKINTGLSMAKLNIPGYEHINNKINYIVLGEMKPRTRIDAHPQDLQQKTTDIDYGNSISALRTQILNLPKLKDEITEGKWYVQLCEYWNKIKHELPNLTDDGLSIQKQIRQGTGKYSQIIKEDHYGTVSTKNQPSLQTISRREFVGPPTMGRQRQPRREWRNKNTNTMSERK